MSSSKRNNRVGVLPVKNAIEENLVEDNAGTTSALAYDVKHEDCESISFQTSVTAVKPPACHDRSEKRDLIFSDVSDTVDEAGIESFPDFAESDSDRDISLIYSKHERVKLKSFSDEVRALMDVRWFLNDSYVVLDLNQSKADKIMDSLLKKMLADCDDPTAFNHLKESLFTHDRMHQLNRTLQGICVFDDQVDYNQNWICVMSSTEIISEARVGLARLSVPSNLSRNCQECRFVMLILTTTKTKGTKSDFEIARTFGTMLSDPSFRYKLQQVRNIEAFKRVFSNTADELCNCQELQATVKFSLPSTEMKRCGFMYGIIGDLRRRLPHYYSDFKDGVSDWKSMGKSISCTMFLYFICILPSIACVLNFFNTKGALIVYVISQEFNVSFATLYACVGLWNIFFLIIYAVFGLSCVIQYSTRSSEEIFAFFISIAFILDAFKATSSNFNEYYFADECQKSYNRTAAVEALTKAYYNNNNNSDAQEVRSNGQTLKEAIVSLPTCRRDVSILYLLLLLGTVWVGLTLYNFTRTPYLTATKREMLADYSLPISVVVMSVIGYFIFSDVKISKSFEATQHYPFIMADLSTLSLGSFFGSMGMGFCLSLLFFMDQNITCSLVNSPHNKLKKGTSYHWDLIVVALINVAPSLFTFPMLHGAIPHSPLHVRALADVEERVVNGHVTETVVRVRETRLASILSHALIAGSLFITHLLAYIPSAVLYGLFLYVAITPLYNNQMLERILLLFTEEAAFPPTYYIRRVPQKKVHLFTFLQLLQLAMLCGVGFNGQYHLKMFFPIFLFLLIPIRKFCIPKIIDNKYVKAMDCFT